MSEQFGIYPDIHWHEITVTVKAFGRGDEFSLPDIKGFRLKDFRWGLCKDSKNNLLLVGHNGTRISITGPKSKLDILYKELKNYHSKSWGEITNIRLNLMDHCRNLPMRQLCDPQVTEKALIKEIEPGAEIPPRTPEDWVETEKICAKCPNFESK